MSNSNILWPQFRATPGHSPQVTNETTPGAWDPAGAWEFQAQLWNQFLELGRSFWAVYTTPMQAMPWLLNTAPTLAAAEVITEPVAVADATSDALESQTRLWNHFLDASRSFWTNDAWTQPGTPWISNAANEPIAVDAPARASKPAPKPAPKRAKPAAKSKAVRRR